MPSRSGGTLSGVKAPGARPEALSPYSLPDFASHTMANRSPPMPQDMGSRKPRAAFTAMAASTAEPPRFSTSTPIWTARGWAAATMPWRAYTIERVANIRPAGRSAAPRGSAIRTTAAATKPRCIPNLPLSVTPARAAPAVKRTAPCILRRLGLPSDAPEGWVTNAASAARTNRHEHLGHRLRRVGHRRHLGSGGRRPVHGRPECRHRCRGELHRHGRRLRRRQERAPRRATPARASGGQPSGSPRRPDAGCRPRPPRATRART